MPAQNTPLISESARFLPADSKTVPSFHFEVPPGAECLKITFDWAPRASTNAVTNRPPVEHAYQEWLKPQIERGDPQTAPDDIVLCIDKLANLVNLIVTDPNGQWRGRSDKGRGAPLRPLYLTPGSPPLGFVDGPLTPGEWRVDLELHAVVPSHCDVQLEVSLCESPQDLKRAIGEPQEQTAVVGERWYRGELHSHSKHSDGGYPVRTLLRRAQELGLDFLALTDHNTVSGLPELETVDFPTIPGVELTTFHGHHIVLGLTEVVPWHDGGRRLPVDEVASRCRELGGLFTLSHPFAVGDPVCTGCRWDSPELDPQHIDLIEIWHRRWRGDRTDNGSARELWNEMWRKGYRPKAIAVRDWHNKQHEAELPGPLPTTAIRAASATPADLLPALKNGAAYCTSGPSIEFAMRSDACTTRLGETGPVGRDVCAVVDLDFCGVSGPARLELYRCGDCVSRVEITQGGHYELDDPSGGPAWYRVEVWQADEPLLITNHIELLS